MPVERKETKYSLHNIEPELPAFYPWTSLQDHNRLVKAVYQYNYRHRTTLRVERGHRDGAVGTWVLWYEHPKKLQQELAQPKPGEVNGVIRDKFGLGLIHFHRKHFVPMRYEPDSDEMREAVSKLNSAVHRYEQRHGIRIILTPGIHDDQFGYWGTVDKDPEMI